MTARLRLDDLHRMALPEQPALHPDGTRVAYVLRTDDRENDTTVRSLWLVTVDRQARRLTRGTADVAPTWSPDGRWLAFVRAQDGPPQLWLLPADGGEPEQLTTLAFGAGTPVWSPDGTRIAFSAAVDAADPDAPAATDRLGYKVDGGGLLRGARKHLHMLDLTTREVTRLTHGDWHAGDPSWSPDGTRLAFPAGRDPDADLTMRSAVYTVEPGGEPRLAGLAEGLAGPVCWTADGEALLVVGRTDTAIGHNGLLRVSGGTAVNLTAPLDRNVMPGGPGYPGGLPQLTDGETVLFCARDRGCTHLYAVPVGGGEPRLVVGGAGRTVAGLSVAGGRAALVLATPTSTGEIALLDGAECQPLTSHGGLDGIELFAHEEREFTISDGTTVHGWLLRDPTRPGPQPLLLDVHGGPHNAWNATADPVHLYHQVLAAEGWAVLLLNPRGSDGYGESFFTAVVGAWGEADAVDLLEPIDRLVAEGVADPARLAVAGYSYGGFMTCHLTGHDDRFAAAVAGGVVSDLTSEAGTSDLGHFLGAWEVGAAPWADPDRYARLSPLSAVDRVRTPTLVVHGAADERCPAGQAEQWFSALRGRRVPSQLVLYPGSSHLFILDGRPSHRLDFNRRIVHWVQRHANRRPPIDREHWQRRLLELAEKYQVPGAALGILRLGAGGSDDEVMVASCGVLNKATGVAASDDSLFQIGSITKVYTATLVMRLVEEGLLRLDTPIAELLPELRLADPEVTKQVTMRHLLTHTSGIDGDIFTDTGRGDDCLERYVGLLAEAAQNHPLGATFSYCNSGFVLAGRVIEKLTGATWDAALRDRLLAPLGLTHTVTLPEQALRFRTAMGHMAEGDAEPVPAPVWELPRSSGPAGAVCASAAEVLAFARLHLTGGVAPDGTRLLAEATVADMARRHAELPDRHSLGDSWGLGWIRFGWDGHRLIGHDGNTLGQSAFLRVLPEAGLAVTLLTNGGHARDLHDALYREIFAELAEVAMPEPLGPAANPPTVDGGRHVGVYERASIRLDVLERPGGLRLRSTVTGPLADLIPDPVEEHDLVPVEENLYVLRPPGGANWVPVTFYSLPTGEAYVHYGVRATPRVR
jgi:dipeptidyl aminopeptidase/acylaminoacyl peptidase/CubicO group peptidase (beta-lactamase class C family)